MAKDERIITRGIRHRDAFGNPIVFTSGMEEELVEALSQEQIDTLTKSGDLVGDFKSTLKNEKAEAEKPGVHKQPGK